MYEDASCEGQLWRTPIEDTHWRTTLAEHLWWNPLEDTFKNTEDTLRRNPLDETYGGCTLRRHSSGDISLGHRNGENYKGHFWRISLVGHLSEGTSSKHPSEDSSVGEHRLKANPLKSPIKGHWLTCFEGIL
jgi:hypothetical protein